MTRPIMWITDEPCVQCGKPGAMEPPYAICPACWLTANCSPQKPSDLRIIHVRERKRMAANLTPEELV